MSERYYNGYRVQTNRLKNFDYGSNGMYFVTINTANREPYFWNQKSVMGAVETQNIASLQHLTNIGTKALECWLEIPKHFPFVVLDEFVIMPDHIHGILIINKANKTGWTPNKFGPQSQNLGSIIRGFKVGVKSYATKNNIEFHWQSRYYDHIIRSEDSLNRIRWYIRANPKKWLDKG